MTIRLLARTAATIAASAVVLVPHAARATGACEDTGATYGPPGAFSEDAEAFAVPGTEHWCEEDDRSGVIEELRGRIEFIELRNLRGEVIGRLASARGRDARRFTGEIGAFEYVPRGRIASVLKQRGYEPLTATSAGRLGRCRARVSWGGQSEQHNGWPARRVAVELLAGDRVLAVFDAGLAVRARYRDTVVRAHFRRGRAGVALWTLVAQCSGPPPGYWGPGIPGNCYRQDVQLIVARDAGGLPELAGCFPDEPAPPAPRE